MIISFQFITHLSSYHSTLCSLRYWECHKIAHIHIQTSSGMKVTIHFQLLPRLWLYGALPSSPLTPSVLAKSRSWKNMKTTKSSCGIKNKGEKTYMMVIRKMKGSTEEMGKICEIKRECMWKNKNENRQALSHSRGASDKDIYIYTYKVYITFHSNRHLCILHQCHLKIDYKCYIHTYCISVSGDSLIDP
jgi:hypothetical protein